LITTGEEKILMAHAEGHVIINCPSTTVYAFLLDGMNNPRWRPTVVDIQRVAGTPEGVGASFIQGLKGPGGRRIDGDYEIIEAEPNTLIRFKVIAGPARPIGVYRLQDDGGATRVTFTLDYTPTGLARIMDPLIARTMRAEVGMLSNLKPYLEDQAK
jgi:uncharacterized membrane protein